MFRVFYYYYYLFYSTVLNDDEPHLLTTLVLSASEGFLINGIVEIYLAKIYCKSIDTLLMIGTFLLLIGINYFYFHWTGKAKEIVKNKPMFFSNHQISIIITVIFFIITASFLFWEPVYVKLILDGNCK